MVEAWYLPADCRAETEAHGVDWKRAIDAKRRRNVRNAAGRNGGSGFAFGVMAVAMVTGLVAGSGVARADVVINEILVSMTGSDIFEFIELYNTDPVNPASLDGLALVLVTGGLSFENSPGDVEDIAILDGFEIPPNGFFVYGDPDVKNLDLEGFDQFFGMTNDTSTYLLVEYNQDVFDADPATDNGGLDVDAPPEDGIADFELGKIIDMIALVDTDTETDFTYYDAPAFGPDALGLFFPAGVARNNDGEDTDTVDDWCELSFALDGSEGGVVPSPGVSNGVNVCSAPVAFGGLTLTGVDLSEEIKLAGNVPGESFTYFRITELSPNATLFDAGTDEEITAVPFSLSEPDDGSPFSAPQVTYVPNPGYTGLDTFMFDATDEEETQDSVDVPYDVAVQGDQLAITEIHSSPLGDSEIYEFIEIHNYSNSDVNLTRLDASSTGTGDTTDNLIFDGTPAVVPAHTTRILAPNTSIDDFICEWDLNLEDMIFLDLVQWEPVTPVTRIFLFGDDATMVDAIDLSLGFPDSPGDGSSLDMRDNEDEFDSLINDSSLPWSYNPDPPPAGRRLSNTQGDTGSPGYVPLLDPEFDPAPPCLGECCLQDGVSCVIVTESECVDELNGIFVFDDGDCDSNPPMCEPVGIGPCCTNWGECLEAVTEFDCMALDGTYFGDGGDCPGDCGAAPASEVVINEVWADDPGADDAEFVELFGPPNTSLAGLSLIVVDGDTGGDETTSQFRRVTLQIDFVSGEATDDDGYFLIGGGTVVDPDHLIETGDLQNGTQTYALVIASDVAYCVDDVVCSEEDDDELSQDSVDAIIDRGFDFVATRDGINDDHIYFGAPLVMDGDFAADHMYRCPNGVDTDSELDWLTSFGNELGDPDDVATPGSENCPSGGGICDTPALCDGDVNGDGMVDPLDTGAILARFGLDATDPAICQYDANCDQVIDPLDSGYVLARFGVCNPVPECELP